MAVSIENRVCIKSVCVHAYVCWWPFYTVSCKHMYNTSPNACWLTFCCMRVNKNYTTFSIVRAKSQQTTIHVDYVVELYFSTFTTHLRNVHEPRTFQPKKKLKRKKNFSLVCAHYICWLLWLCTKHLHLDKLVIHRTDRNGWDTQHGLYKCVACSVRECCAEPCLRKKRNEQF